MSVGLHQGDCLDVLPMLPDASVDMVFADLPYGVTANKWDTPIPLEPLWAELLRIGKPRCAYVFTATQPFATTLICSQRKLFRYDLIWEKPNAVGFLNANKSPLRAHESLLLFSCKAARYNPQMRIVNRSLPAMHSKANRCYNTSLSVTTVSGNKRFPRSVLYIDHDRECGRLRKLHPTQKPVALLEWLIKTYTNEGDTVLDPTMGSGTTGVACLNTGRSFVGIELDQNYFKVASDRIGLPSLEASA